MAVSPATVRLGLQPSIDLNVSDAAISELMTFQPDLVRLTAADQLPFLLEPLADVPTWLFHPCLVNGERFSAVRVEGDPNYFVDEIMRAAQQVGRGLGERLLLLEPMARPDQHDQGWRQFWGDGAGFADWWLKLLSRFQRYGEDRSLPLAGILFPALSPEPGTSKTDTTYQTFLRESERAWRAADGLAIHVSWGERNPLAAALEVVATYAELAPELPLWVTEAVRTGPADPDERARDYATFWRELANYDQVAGVNFLVADSAEPDKRDLAWAPQALAARFRSFADLAVDPPPARPNATFLADLTLADDAPLVTNSDYVKQWRVRNSGDVAWGDGYHLVRTDGNLPTEMEKYPLDPVGPGEIAAISLPLRTPAQPGTYFSNWRLHDPAGEPFGDTLWVRISVAAAPIVKAGLALTEGAALPEPFWPGETFALPLIATNDGEAAWSPPEQYAIAAQLEPLQGQPAPPVSIVVLSKPVPPNRQGPVNVPLHLPAAAGTYAVHFEFHRAHESGTTEKVGLTQAPEVTVRVMDVEEAADALATLHASARSRSRQDAYRRVSDAVAGLQEPSQPQTLLVDGGLLPALFDEDWQVGRLALNGLFAARDHIADLSDRLQAEMGRQTTLAPLAGLLQRPVQAEAKAWLLSLIPFGELHLIEHDSDVLSQFLEVALASAAADASPAAYERAVQIAANMAAPQGIVGLVRLAGVQLDAGESGLADGTIEAAFARIEALDDRQAQTEVWQEIEALGSTNQAAAQLNRRNPAQAQPLTKGGADFSQKARLPSEQTYDSTAQARLPDPTLADLGLKSGVAIGDRRDKIEQTTGAYGTGTSQMAQTGARTDQIDDQPAGAVEPAGELEPPEPTITDVASTDAAAAGTAATSTAPAAAATPAAQPSTLLQPIIMTNPYAFIDRDHHQAAVEKAPAADELRINVNEKTVTLIFTIDGKKREFSSKNLIDPVRLLELMAKPTAYGEALFAGIINDKASVSENPRTATATGFQLALDRAQADLRVELYLDPADIGLHAHRWELLRAPDSPPLASLESRPFYRRVAFAGASLPPPATPLKVLVVFCNPKTLGRADAGSLLAGLIPIDIAQEREIIRDALKPLAAENVVTYEILGDDAHEAATSQAIMKKLALEKFHVVHLVAHGIFSGKNEFFLVMEDDNRDHAFVSAEKFRDLLPAAKDRPRLLVLCSCQSAVTATGHAFRGLGPRLVLAGVPAVVAMQDLIPVDTAQLFSQHFYHNLARSGRVDQAMAATRLALFHEENPRLDLGRWAIPVLFMGSDAVELFKVNKQLTEKLSPQPEKVTVKNYEDLAGKGSPRLQQAAQLLAQERGWTQPPQTWLQQIQSVVAAPVTAPPAGPATQLALAQNRRQLARQIPTRLKVDAAALREYISGRYEKQPNGVEVQVKKGATPLRLPDIVFYQIASALNGGKHIVLTGPPGTGKTSLAGAICDYATAARMANGAALTTATADWTTFDTIGGYVPTEAQTLAFRPGLFLETIRQGQWLVIDEMNRAEIDKAFGELFTVLSGQPVDLPYKVDNQSVRVLTPRDQTSGESDEGYLAAWWPAGGDTFDYVIHPNWRIIGTMNVYDKSYLFAMSFAFMRRFAFIEIDVPEHDAIYRPLIEMWLTEFLLGLDGVGRLQLLTAFDGLLAPAAWLMRHRALGPAIARDMIKYLGDRFRQQPDASALTSMLAEAFMLYVVPQLDGLDQLAIRHIYQQVMGVFVALPPSEMALVLKRIRLLYPHMHDELWPQTPNEEVT